MDSSAYQPSTSTKVLLRQEHVLNDVSLILLPMVLCGGS
jgi:hypothetical protein